MYRTYELAVDTGIPDLSLEPDHYIYGTPKTKAARRRQARQNRRR
ncbi:MAG: hypothetical protein WD749_12370 [Phycisphaerales bacterium]